MKSIDPFLGRTQTKDYNCLAFTREVWAYLFGEDIIERLSRLLGSVSHGKVSPSAVREFRELKTPSSPCFVVMQRKGFSPHVGIFLEDRVLHLTRYGVQYQPLLVARTYFKTVRYYE